MGRYQDCIMYFIHTPCVLGFLFPAPSFRTHYTVVFMLSYNLIQITQISILKVLIQN